MRVILMANVPSLGKAGDIVQVAAGYGRNFLLPKKLALEASTTNRQLLARQKETFWEKASKEKDKAQEAAVQIENLSLVLERTTGDHEKIFGSVTALVLQKLLGEHGVAVDRRKIVMPAPLKSLGSFTVPVKLHTEVTAQLKVNIVPSTSEKGKR